jgi:hypothetical protein
MLKRRIFQSVPTALAALLCAAVLVAADEPRVTVWSGDLVLDHTYEVPEGYTLRIEPGTVVRMEDGWDAKIVVKGTLEAVGTKDRPVELRAEAPGYWGGITFQGPQAAGRVEHCLVENGRIASVHCAGASPVIRHNRFVTGEAYGEGWVFCEDEAKPVVEGNTFVSGGERPGPAAVVCEGAAPVIRGNTFERYAVAVQLYGYGEDAARPEITGNAAKDCGVLVFDQGTSYGSGWEEAWASDPLERPAALRVEAEGGRDVAVTYHTSPTEVTGKRRLVWQGGAYHLDTCELEAGLDRVPESRVKHRFADRPGEARRILVARSGGGLMRREGCMDTKPAFVLLLAGEGEAARIAWRSPKFDRGHLLASAADLDGDGESELVVCTGRWCENKGRILVYRCSAAGPTKSADQARPLALRSGRCMVTRRPRAPAKGGGCTSRASHSGPTGIPRGTAIPSACRSSRRRRASIFPRPSRSSSARTGRASRRSSTPSPSGAASTSGANRAAGGSRTTPTRTSCGGSSTSNGPTAGCRAPSSPRRSLTTSPGCSTNWPSPTRGN